MFSDSYGLTEAVLSGCKTQTRRICKEQYWSFSDIINANENQSFIFEQPKYQIGEVVAVAQPYVRVASGTTDWLTENWEPKPEFEVGWNNKLFVRADLMPHQIRITNVRVERLNEISDADCLAEGVERAYIGFFVKGLKCKDWEKESHAETEDGVFKLFPSPREAYAALIDRISGKGTWNSNPWVFAYDFELVK